MKQKEETKEPISWVTILMALLMAILFGIQGLFFADQRQMLFVAIVCLAAFFYALATQITMRQFFYALALIGLIVGIVGALYAAVLANRVVEAVAMLVVLVIIARLWWIWFMVRKNQIVSKRPYGALRLMSRDSQKARNIYAAVETLWNEKEEERQKESDELNSKYSQLPPDVQAEIDETFKQALLKAQFEHLYDLFPLLTHEHQEQILNQILAFAAEDIQEEPLKQTWFDKLAAVSGLRQLNKKFNQIKLGEEETVLLRQFFSPRHYSLQDIEDVKFLLDAWTKPADDYQEQ